MKQLFKVLAQNKAMPRRFEIKAMGSDAVEVFMYDAIVNDAWEAEMMGGIAPQNLVPELRAITAGTIHLRINSPGGSVFGARAIEQALREHPAKVIAHIDGLAASAATFIAMAADEVVMSSGALWMIHNAWGVAMGDHNDMLETAALLEKIDGTLIDTYAKRTGQTPEQLAEWMAAETWFTADEAVAAGFADSIAEEKKASARWNLSAYPKAPAQPEPITELQTNSIDVGAYLRSLEVVRL